MTKVNDGYSTHDLYEFIRNQIKPNYSEATNEEVTEKLIDALENLIVLLVNKGVITVEAAGMLFYQDISEA